MYVIDAETTFKRVIKCILLCAAAFFFGPFLLVPGFKKMRTMPPEDPNRKVLKYALLVGSFAYLACGLWLGWIFILGPMHLDKQPEFGEHLPGVPWLMQEATDVSYYRSYSYTAYEFTITEEAFRNALTRRELKEISEPITIGRYNKMHALPEGETQAVIRKGLWTGEQSFRGKFLVVYDREAGKAYFQESPLNK